jgi:hypothetical protein
MPGKPVINIVATRCQPVDDEKFNRWYNEVHIPMLLKYKKLLGVARYKVITESTLPSTSLYTMLQPEGPSGFSKALRQLLQPRDAGNLGSKSSSPQEFNTNSSRNGRI